ncbi:hypothetical protein AYI70_g5277 [Smittium culicis]|uniref:Uncharacterized protein n=1 Tax=Smittium culicis TaxID=133412 RepID=A0A1R1XVE2_9FUNG|nr:hypothetical protein AYI70_g5277 [Smittium culicis]
MKINLPISNLNSTSLQTLPILNRDYDEKYTLYLPLRPQIQSLFSLRLFINFKYVSFLVFKNYIFHIYYEEK